MGIFDSVKDKVDGINTKRKQVKAGAKLSSDLKTNKYILGAERDLVGAIYIPLSGDEGGFLQYYVHTRGTDDLTDDLLDSEYVSSVTTIHELTPNYDVLAVELTPAGQEIVPPINVAEEPAFGPDDRLNAAWAELDRLISTYLDDLISHAGVGYITPPPSDRDECDLTVFILEDYLDGADPVDLIEAPFLLDIESSAIPEKQILTIDLYFDPFASGLFVSPDEYEREDTTERAELADRLAGVQAGR